MNPCILFHVEIIGEDGYNREEVYEEALENGTKGDQEPIVVGIIIMCLFPV